MSLTEKIAIACIVLVLIGAVVYLVKAKKNGVKCVGCPNAKACASKRCNCGCNETQTSQEEK